MQKCIWAEKEFRFDFIKRFHYFGMLLTRLNGVEGDANSFKNPSEIWRGDEQTLSFLESKDWENSTGVGIKLGINGYRAIDIDSIGFPQWDSTNWADISDFERPARMELIQNCLRILGLPSTYEWVIKTPHGYHIIFRTVEISDMPDSIAYAPNKYFSDKGSEQLYFSRMELLWRTHLVLAPSISSIDGKNNGNYDFDYNYYQFCFCLVPQNKPSVVSIGNIDDLLNYYCGEEGFANMLDLGFATQKANGAMFFKATIKDKLCRGSEEEMEDYLEAQVMASTGGCTFVQFVGLDSKISWLKACSTPETLNKLGLLSYMVNNDVNQAVQYFKRSQTSYSYYNLACLIATGTIPGGLVEMNYYLEKAYADKHEADLLRVFLQQRVNNLKNYKIFIALSTTAKQDEVNSFSLYNNIPRLIQLCSIMTDETGNVLNIGTINVKPMNFIIPPFVEKCGGLSQDIAETYGDESYGSALVTLLNNMVACNTVICFDAPFCVRILQNEVDSANIPMPEQEEIPEHWSDNGIICLKKSGTIMMKNYYGEEVEPSLKDMFEQIVGKKYINSKDAVYNADCIRQLYFAMQKTGAV